MKNTLHKIDDTLLRDRVYKKDYTKLLLYSVLIVKEKPEIKNKEEFTEIYEKMFGYDEAFMSLINRIDNVELFIEYIKELTNDNLSDLMETIMSQFGTDIQNGAFYTPEDISSLCSQLLLCDNKKDFIRIYDCSIGTSNLINNFQSLYNGKLEVYGQELDEDSFCISKLNMISKNLQGELYHTNTLTENKIMDEVMDFAIANPPFGINFKQYLNSIKKQNVRFKYIPRTSDGTILFMQDCINKLKANGKAVIITNAAPLFNGDAGSAESEFRKYLFENDLIESIIQLPQSLFINTSISTYIWIINKQKPEGRKGKTQLINAADLFERLKKGIGDKKNHLSESNIAEILNLYKSYAAAENSKIFDNSHFGYIKVDVRRESDAAWKDTETIPLEQSIQDYMNKWVLPHIPDAKLAGKQKVGYEINFNSEFFKFKPLRPHEELKAEILENQKHINELMKEIFGE